MPLPYLQKKGAKRRKRGKYMDAMTFLAILVFVFLVCVAGCMIVLLSYFVLLLKFLYIKFEENYVYDDCEKEEK